jgi:hypothetical protein
LITKKHDDIAVAFTDRMARDQCSPGITWNFNNEGNAIVSVTVTTAMQNRCRVPVPVTVPVAVYTLPAGATREQVGNDPLTIWVKMDGQPVTITLGTPLRV